MKKKQFIFFACCIAFILLNCVAILKEFLIFPWISLVVVIVYLMFYRLDWLMYILAFLTPLSVPMGEFTRMDVDLSLPAEIIMAAITLLFIFRLLYDLPVKRKLFTHPISIGIYIYLAWILITSISSELPIVSVKFLISKIWFIVPCFFVILQFFSKNTRKIITFFNCYAVGLAIVVLYTTFRHATFGFSMFSSHWVMSPFYNDHTAYGAVLAFFLPITAGFIFLPGNNKTQRLFYIILSVIIATGLYFSFSRAAWLSMIGAIGVLVLLKLRIKLSWVVLGSVILGAAFFLFADDILYKMGRNTQDSSGNLKEQIQSISNITTDASNVERLNRWVAAQGMIKERPIVGWGPGTYQFVYAPFQKGKYKTIISTNFGDGGNAHSEYIGPFAETGIIGLLTVLALVFMALFYGIKTYIQSKDKFSRLLCLCMLLALITYFIHGVLNNFLDTDKLSLPYWAAFATITILSVKSKEDQNGIPDPQKNELKELP